MQCLLSFLLSLCSFAPTPTTISKTTTPTMAELPQLAKDCLPSIPPSTDDSDHTGAPCTPITPSADVFPVPSDDEDDEEDEEGHQGCNNALPQLVPIITGTSYSKSLTSSSSSPSPTLLASNEVFDKSPLWAPSTSAHSGLTNTGVYCGLGGVNPLSGIPAPTLPVNTSMTMPHSLGIRNVLVKATPATSAVISSSKNIVHVPMMYQLTTSHPGVSQPLVSPILTMVPPTMPSVASLMNLPPSVFMTTPTSSSIHQSLIGSKLSMPNKNIDMEVVPDSTSTEIGRKEVVSHIFKSGVAETATGQNISYSEAMKFESSCCSPSSSSVGSPVPRILASIPHSELTPEQIELKCFAEDFKTRRIKLGFTQGSVGQSLAEKGYSNFAQSTISRFEQMQLSPTNATTIRVVLEQWLLEEESPEIANSSSSSTGNIPAIASRKRKKRAVFAPLTKSSLDTFFLKNPRPNRQAIEEISQQLDLLPEEVRVWFCNKRQKSKPNAVSPIRSLSFGHESSTTLRGTPSPTPLFDGSLGMQQRRYKHRSASPPKVPFTIEELCKSSNTTSTNTTMSSHVHLMSPSKPHVDLITSGTRSDFASMLANRNFQMLNNPYVSPFVVTSQVAQTIA